MGHLTKILNPPGKNGSENWFVKKAKILKHNISELRIMSHEDKLQHYSANNNQTAALYELRKLAKLYAKQGEFKEALERMESISEIEKFLGEQSNLTKAYLLVYKALVYEGQANESEDEARAAKLKREAGQFMDKATKLFLEKGKYKEAIETGKKAGDFYSDGNLHGDAHDAYLKAADSATEHNDKFKALEIYGLALKQATFEWQENAIKEKIAKINEPMVQNKRVFGEGYADLLV